MLRATPFALQLYYSYILFVFLNMFSVVYVCTFTHCLFCFCFSSIMIFCSVKAPRKAVLFHEYQASTGRFNKFVSLLAATLSFFMNAVSQRVSFCVSLFNYRPPRLKKICIIVLSESSQSFHRSACVSVCVRSVYEARPSIREAQQLQVHLKPNCTNVKRNCIFQ